ncbi:MAG TPA: SDR family oxidoreductase [Streptosporangiaceae bacterium]|nr:SDR family oxidoreductase [Streptosporangiaceae bacterium]
MDLGIRNKVALVAGGSSGIGLAIATELAAEGAHVAICGRDPERLATAERTLKGAARGTVRADRVDITDQDAARRWVDGVAADHGGALHILVAGGGTPPTGAASQFAPADYRAAVDLVLLPAVNLTLAALPHLTMAGWGRILFIASETASRPVAWLALSGVTRAGLVRFAQSLAAETGCDGITVNVLAPSATRTPMIERAAVRLAADGDGDVEAQLHAMGEHTALRRIARPDEIAAMAAFLVSDRASYVTGGVHLVDGGTSVTGPEARYLPRTRAGTYR